MSIQCHVFIATSLDGYIAREDGRIDWLEEYNATLPQGEDCGYAKFYAAIDCVVMGRKTFEKVISFSHWPFTNKHVIVMSKNLTPQTEALPQKTVFTAEPPTELLKRLEQQGFKNIYVDGGELIQSFLRQNLIQSLTITRIPILLGKGKSLFGSLENDLKLKHNSSRSWPFGFVQDHYTIPQN